jgi:hypothetical protein
VRAALRGAPASDAANETGEAWRELLDTLAKTGEFVLGRGAPDTEQDRMEGWRHLAILLRMGLGEMTTETDPDRPRFSWSDGTGKWGLDCSDALYCQAPLREGCTYRIRGNRGSAHFMGFQLVGALAAAGDLDADALLCDAAGNFELVLGGVPRANNWLAVPPGRSTLIVRQFFYDWDRERPASFEIERTDAGPRLTQPAPTAGGVAAQLRALGRFVHDNTEWWARVACEKRERAVNSFPDDGGGLGSVATASQTYQAFGIGYFSLDDDQALVIEVAPPRAKYWSLHLGNYWMESLDFANYQSSLNGGQARLDADGVFRAVVSRRDPGVPNWLDPAGRREGSMIYRWNQADAAPIPKCRVVKLADLRALLPRETPVVTPDERRAAIERRRDAIRRRYARP